jgi:protein-tyrosine phosphatase
MSKPTLLALGIGFAGFVCAALGLSVSGLGRWLGLWTALSCFAVAAAYATNRPEIFGKRDGRLAAERVLLLLPYLVAFRVACSIMRLFRRGPPWSEVAPGVYVGARVQADELPPGVDLVVDLTSELPEPAGLRRRPGYRCVPVLDGAHPRDEEAFLEILGEVALHPGGVLFHCESGRGRAPTAAALALMARGLVEDRAAALELVRKGRPEATPTRSDVAFIDRIAARLRATERDPVDSSR